MEAGARRAMQIANPIYDVVFKYLLDDERVAKLLLSALLGREVLDLKYRATEVRSDLPPSVLILRLDFAATVRLVDGTTKLVLIEIQKAQTPLDVIRFRKYIGAQYMNPDNILTEAGGKRQALPLVTVYFLGEGLDHTDAPVVRVKRQYWDAATEEAIGLPEPFVEALTHDAIIVQINRLKDRRRTELELLLMVFDQTLAASGDAHFLDIREEDYPERYQAVLRRLTRAFAEKKVRDGMDVEDEFLHILLDKDRVLAESLKALGESLQALGENHRALEEKEKAIGEKDQVIDEKDKLIDEKDKLIEDLKRRLDRG